MKIFPTGPSYCDAIKSLDRPSKSWASEACDTINTNTQIQYIDTNTFVFKQKYLKTIIQN